MRKHAVVCVDVERHEATDTGDAVERVEEEPLIGQDVSVMVGLPTADLGGGGSGAFRGGGFGEFSGRRQAVRSTLVIVCVALGASGARAQDVNDDGRIAIILSHPIAGEFSGAPYFWFDDQTGGVKRYRVSFPNVIYHATPWLQGWGGLIVYWTDNQSSGNTRELRPYLGMKVFVPNSAHIHLYNLTRFEWRRITNTETDTIERKHRFRTQPSAEFPLSARAWGPGTFYGLANVEVFVEHAFVDALRFASGGGYIKSDRVRVEFQYLVDLSRKTSTDPLAYSDNSFRLDFKVSLKEGLHRKQEGPEY